jgi:hypothetical protein
VEYCFPLEPGRVCDTEPRSYGDQTSTIVEFTMDADVDATTVTAEANCAVEGVVAASGVTQGDAGNKVRVEFDPTLADQNCCTITLSGGASGSWDVKLLVGDVDCNGTVTTTDKDIITGVLGWDLSVDDNYKFDVNTSGSITTTDKDLIIGLLGNSVPACP